jgi:hypothetical protein
MLENIDYEVAHAEAENSGEQEAINRAHAFIDQLIDECNAAGVTDIRETF